MSSETTSSDDSSRSSQQSLSPKSLQEEKPTGNTRELLLTTPFVEVDECSSRDGLWQPGKCCIQISCCGSISD